ncbi:hypothetical protein Tco_0999283, partial [Tanacetum coccineum]
MCKVAALSPDPIKSLLPPSREVNADDTADKSSSETSVQPVTQESSPTTQVAETQPVEETLTIADATKSLYAFESAEEQVNQPKTAEAKK